MFKRDFWKEKRFQKITASLFLLAVFLCLSFLGSGSGIKYEEANSGADIDDKDVLADTTDEESADPTVNSEVIFVDVIGCVVTPGVYQLPAGSRVYEAIELAGGMTDEAEVQSVNRAALLRDEQVIRVLSVEEYEEAQKDGGGIGFVDGKVDLNTADSKALESLSGIGPSMAEKIIAYRDDHGGFDTIEDLMKIDGIGEKTFQRLKASICVQ